jgi:pilus assembly protein CpaD
MMKKLKMPEATVTDAAKAGLKPLFAAAAMLALAGCGGFNGPEAARDTPEMMHPITVTKDTATLKLDAAMDLGYLNDRQKAQISAFAQAYNERGHGPMVVSVPDKSMNKGAASDFLSDVSRALADQGVGGDSVVYKPYQVAADQTSAPVVMTFTRYKATASPCGDWSMNYAYNPENVNPPNFGCATQNNLAAMVADPADLVRPRTMDPADAERRDTVIQKYRKGDVTASQRSDKDSAAVSEVK